MSQTQETKRGVLVVGAYGRMGGRVVAALSDHPTLRAAVGLIHPSQTGDARPAHLDSDMLITTDMDEALQSADVVIDFSAPPVCCDLAPRCAEQGVPYLIASTGTDETHRQAIEAAAQKTAMLPAANCSLGVNVLLEAVELVASRLGNFDVEISEIHHRYKRDAPSGTALALGDAVKRGRGAMDDVMGRSGVGEPRSSNQLGYNAIRGGTVPGDHTVFFLGDDERVELSHSAASADIFAAGAVRGAAWLIGKAPGLYQMRDVLGGDS